MSNDGWGKLPTNSDGWGYTTKDLLNKAVDFQDKLDAPKPVAVSPFKSTSARGQAASGAIQTDGGWGVPAQDGWGKSYGDTWGEHAVDWSEIPAATQANIIADQIETNWTAEALEGASNRAAVINSLRGVKDQYTIDQDGELSSINETLAKPSDKETGVYIAYSNGKWLHAVLSGPYATRNEADKWADVAFDLLTQDGAFKLAFENTFDRDGIYHAEIPLSAKRNGAFGVLT